MTTGGNFGALALDAQATVKLFLLQYATGRITARQLSVGLVTLARHAGRTKRAVAQLRSDAQNDVDTTRARCAALIAKRKPPAPKPATASFVLTPPIKVDPPKSAKPTWTLNETAGTATWREAPFEVRYTFEVPKALTPGQSFPIKLRIDCTRNTSSQISFAIGVLAEGIQQDNRLDVTAPTGGGEGSKTLTLSVPKSAGSAKEFFITVGIGDGFTLTYRYQPAGA